MRRFLPAGAGALAVVPVVAILGGTGSAGFLLPVVLAAIVGSGVAWLVSRMGGPGDGAWVHEAAFEFVPSAPHHPGGVGAVSVALGRVEARELAASASFGVGLGLSAVVVVLFGFVFSDDFGGDLPRFFELLPILVHPVVGLSVLAAFRGRTRARRDDLEELFATCPTTPATRTCGHLTTAWVSAAAAAATAALVLLGLRSNAAVLFGDVGGRQLASFLVVGVLGCGGIALGVLLARLLPWTLVPVVVVVVIGFGSARLATNGEVSNPVRQLSTWLGDPEVYVRFTAPHWVARVIWLVALVTLVAGLAVLRDLRRPWVLGAVTGSVAVAVVSAWAVTRPIDGDDAVRIAALLADPQGAQDCVVTGPVSVCSYEDTHELRDRYVQEVTPVVADVPAVAAPVVIRWAEALDPLALDPEVRALLPDAPDEPGLLPVEMVAVDDAFLGARIWAGLAAVGLTEELRPGRPVDVSGQAPGVLALWLATRGADDEAASALTSVGDPDSFDGSGYRPWPDPCYAGTAPVTWALDDVAAARALVGLPAGRVESVVFDDWARFTDPSTTTEALLAAIGLEVRDLEARDPDTSGRTPVVEC